MTLIHIQESLPAQPEDTDLSDLIDKDGFNITQETVRTAESKIASLRRRSAILGPTERALLESLLAEVIGSDNAKQVTTKYFTLPTDSKEASVAKAATGNSKPTTYFTIPATGKS